MGIFVALYASFHSVSRPKLLDSYRVCISIHQTHLKGILQIDDECVKLLNQIKDLELLHLGGTSVTLDGLSKLKDLQKLKVLLVSVPETEKIKEKMLLLKAMLPHCDFILNYKSYEFDEVNNNAQTLQ